MQFENPLQTSYSSSSSVMTSSNSFTNHQPTPFYIDNILGSVPAAVSDETESSATPGTLGVSSDLDQGSTGIHNASPSVSIGNILDVQAENLIQSAGNILQNQRSPENGQVSSLRPLNSPYLPVVSNADINNGNSFLSPPSPNLQNGLSPTRPAQIIRPIVRTPVQSVPAHHPGVLGYPTHGSYSRPANIYDPPGGAMHSPYNPPPIQYNSNPYAGHPAPTAPRLDTYTYPRHDYSWFLERQASFNKGKFPVFVCRLIKNQFFVEFAILCLVILRLGATLLPSPYNCA